MQKTDLSLYNNSWYNPGASLFKRILWYYTNILFFKSAWLPISRIKVALLRFFGAHIGKGVVIKPCVNIKYPWNLKIGDYCWIGEQVWIDNLTQVTIGSHVCISQGAMLLCGNHNYKVPSFDLMIGSITLEDGVWIGAKSIVCHGVTCHEHAMLCVNSVAGKELMPYTIYRGNPAIAVKTRDIQ